jgi:hypothetical protein
MLKVAILCSSGGLVLRQHAGFLPLSDHAFTASCVQHVLLLLIPALASIAVAESAGLVRQATQNAMGCTAHMCAHHGLQWIVLQVDMFSDYASLTSSSLSRSSSAAGEMAAAGSTSPTSPRRADLGHVPPAHSDNVSQRPFSPVAAEQPQPVPVPARQLSTMSATLSGSLQSTVESLHAIVETLPGARPISTHLHDVRQDWGGLGLIRCPTRV